jgi:hypothetical protein
MFISAIKVHFATRSHAIYKVTYILQDDTSSHFICRPRATQKSLEARFLGFQADWRHIDRADREEALWTDVQGCSEAGRWNSRSRRCLRICNVHACKCLRLNIFLLLSFLYLCASGCFSSGLPPVKLWFYPFFASRTRNIVSEMIHSGVVRTVCEKNCSRDERSQDG